MTFFRNSILIQLISLLLILLIVNISIDPPDVLKNIDADVELEEDLTVNEIESITELVLESVLAQKNAVPETDDPDSDNVLKKMDLYIPHTFEFIEISINDCDTYKYPNLYSEIISRRLPVFSPPPDGAI